MSAEVAPSEEYEDEEGKTNERQTVKKMSLTFLLYMSVFHKATGQKSCPLKLI